MAEGSSDLETEESLDSDPQRCAVVPHDSRSSSKSKSILITPRPYQEELLEDALCENTVVNLGTGAGKTYIAVMLIKELSYQILDKPFSKTAKRTIFLVPTVPLVKQQAKYLEVYTMLDVGQYIGEMNVDSWSMERWWEELSKYNILVMTHTIFKNILQGGFIHLRNVNLLVFDECHHAVKNHDYVQIMKMFDSCPNDPPRILGLSASLLPNKCKPGELEKQIKKLETTLDCRCQTARDLQEVAIHATNPDEETHVYRSSPLPHLERHTTELRTILSGPLDFLNSLPKKQREEACYINAKLNLDDCLHILDNLGIWSALNCAEQCITGLNSTLLSEAHFLEPPQKALLGLSLTHLSMFSEKAKRLHQPNDVDVTYKVQLLIQCLRDQLAVNRAASQKKMLGIVFVERRMTALILSRMLNSLTASDPKLASVKCGYIVGHSDTRGMTTLRKEAHMKVKKQNEIIEKFRKGKITLLIATSVVEEGLDIPRCNLVIRFDFPPNIRSYIQSKGRARAKPSKYILMIEDMKQGKAMSDLNGYHIVEEDMQKLCHDRAPPDDEEFLKFLEKQECNYYAPYGIEAGVRATLSSSLSFLYKYCQKFSDKFTSFAPIFEHESRPRALSLDPYSENQPHLTNGTGLEFRSTVQLPICCPIRDKITGHWMPERRRIADKSAALAAIRELHRRGELNEHLQPVTRDPDSEPDEEEEEKHAGTEKKSKYYRNEVPSTLQGCFPTNGSGNHLYILLMEEADTDIKKFPFSKQPPQGPHHAVGILTQKPLPYKQIPEFSIFEKRLEIRVKVIELSTPVATLSNAEINLLKRCHQAMFESVLKISSSYLKCSFGEMSANFLVVPIGVWQMQDPPLAYIDFEMAERVVDTGDPNTHYNPLQWPFPYEDAVVTKAYMREEYLLEVIDVNTEITPTHEFPTPSYNSYAEYFLKKYEVHIKDLQQPALECKKLYFSETRLRLITSRFKDTHGVDQSTSKHISENENLFAEVTRLYPLPASFVKVMRCLPSMLWRIESLLLVNDLRSDITSSTGVGKINTTSTHLQGYRDYGLGKLETQWNFESDLVPVIIRGPGNALLLQAVTLSPANDSIDNERLETLGDSFLKLATSVFLYCDRPNAQEGRLTSARTRRIGNLNLFRLAKKKKMMGKILSMKFSPTGGWIPPCFTFTQCTSNEHEEEGSAAHLVKKGDELSDLERQYVYHKVTDKGVADFMESLIGAYLVSGGMEAALRVMKWMGLKITRKRTEEEGGSQEMSEGEVDDEPLDIPRSKRYRQSPEHDHLVIDYDDANLLIDGSPVILKQHFGPAPPSLFDPSKENDVIRMLRCGTGSLEPGQIQGIVQWTFKDKALLLQALTHASYQRNRVTDCYQRLEFLGDAVLDYLITIQIYERFPRFDPGKITDMRSALVNNNLFAELAVKLKLHKLFLHSSPTLFRLIPEYERFITTDHNSMEDEESVEMDQHPGSDTPSPEGMEEEMDSDNEDDEVEPPKVLGDLLESLAGAIFMDSGMDLQAVWDTLGPLFNEKMEQFKDKIPIPPIKELHQRFPQVEVKCHPAGQGRTRCTVKCDGREVAEAWANSRKTAKNAAARVALQKLSE